MKIITGSFKYGNIHKSRKNIYGLIIYICILFLYLPVTYSMEKNLFPNSNNDTLDIVRNINLSKKFHDSENPVHDSSLYYLNKALDIAVLRGNNVYLYQIYDKFANILYDSGSYYMAVDYYFKMLNILDEKSDNDKNVYVMKEYSNLYKKIGVCMTINDINKALEYFRKSLAVIEEIDYAYAETEDIHLKKVYIYNNIGSAWIHIENFDSASYYYNKALNYPVKFDDPAYYASLYNNLAIINWELGEHEESFEFNKKSLEIRSGLGDKFGMASIHHNMGLCNYYQKNIPEALKELNLSLQMSKESHNIRIQLASAHALSKIYGEQKDYYKCTEMLQLANMLKDSVAGIEKINRISKTELEYLLEKQIRESELKQQILVSEKERKALIIIFIAIFLLLSVIVLILLYRNQRIKNNKNLLEQESLSLQNENLELKNEQLNQRLEYKNHELNTHMRYLLNKNEFVASIMENVSELKGKDTDQVRMAMRDMKINIEDSVWNELNVLFQDLHQDFYSKLFSKHSNLTPNEKKLCALIRLNLSSKEISSITFQSVKSIEIARSRLRKKLDLNRDENLNLYLQQF